MADTDNKSMSWRSFFTLIALVVVTLYATYMTGLHSGANGGRLAIQVGKTEIVDRQTPDLTSDLDAANKRNIEITKEMEALVASHRMSIADVQSRLVAKSNELDEARSELSTANLRDNTRQVNAALAQSDRAFEARDIALAEVADIKSSMANLATVTSNTLTRLGAQHTATIAAIESRLNQEKARELAVKDATIAQLQRTIDAQRRDLTALQFTRDGNVAQVNENVTFEILTNAMPAGHTFEVRFEQRNELTFNVTMPTVQRSDTRIPTALTAQVPPPGENTQDAG